MGQPGILNRMSSRTEFIGAWKQNAGKCKASQYLQEGEIKTEIPSVAASEPRGTAQNQT